MGTMTVTVKDNVEKRFRKAASQELGKRKGYLGKAVTAAMEEWMEKKGTDPFEQGFRLGGLKEKSREAWHERRAR